MHPAVNKSVITILETDTALAAARLMKETETGCLMVVDARGKLTGIVTGRDLVMGVLAPDKSAKEVPIKEVMTRSPMTAQADDVALKDLAKILSRGRVRRLPIVDESHKPVGLIALEDLLVHASDILHSCATAVSPYLTVARLRSASMHRE